MCYERALDDDDDDTDDKRMRKEFRMERRKKSMTADEGGKRKEITVRKADSLSQIRQTHLAEEIERFLPATSNVL